MFSRSVHAPTRCARVIAAGLLVCLIAPELAHVLASQPPPPKPTDLRVMSFNIRFGTAKDGENHWEHRRDLAIETIRAYDPDLLGLQECLAFQADELRDALEGYEVIAVGRDDGQRAGEMTAIFYRRDRFERLDAGHFWLSEQPEVVASKGWDAAITRMASWVRLRTREEPSYELLFLNTHFDHVGRVARLESARLIRQRVETLRRNGPAIIVGDFNAPARLGDDQPYAALRRGKPETPELIDPFARLHPDRTDDVGTFHGFRGGLDGDRIDWVLVTDHFTPVTAAIDTTQRDGRYPSDHYPVTATLRPSGVRD